MGRLGRNSQPQTQSYGVGAGRSHPVNTEAEPDGESDGYQTDMEAGETGPTE